MIQQRSLIAAVIAISTVAMASAQGPGQDGFGGPPPGGGFGRGGFGGGQRGRFGPPPGGPGMLMNPEVQKELHLSPDQLSRLHKLMPPPPRMDRGQGGPGGGPGRPPFSPEDREKRDKELKSILSHSQFARLEQIRLQMEGARAILRPDIAKELGITDSERQAIRKLQPGGGRGMGGGRRGFGGPGGPGFGGPRGPGDPGFGGPGGSGGPGDGPPPPRDGQGGPPPRDGMRGGPGERPPMGMGPEFRANQEAKVLAILTPQQRSKWQKMIGKPFKFSRPSGRPPQM